MNVVSVTLDYADCSGGSTESVRQFAAALGGPTVSFTSASLLDRCVRAPGVVHVPVSGAGALYGMPNRAALRAAEEQLRGAAFVFCHLLYRYHCDWVRSVAARYGIPYCVVPHGALDPWVFTYRGLRKRVWLASVGHRLFGGSAGVLFATSREREKAATWVEGCRSWVVNWPVPYCQVDDPEGARRRVRAGLGIAPADRVLLFLGRLHSMKRPKETIAAFARAASPGAHLIVAGPDDEYSASDLAGAPNVHVIGPVYGAAKWELYHAADAFVNLSARENFGYTVAEAVAAGLPVVLSPGNDLRGELDPLRCGFLLETDSPAEAVAALQTVLSAPPDMLRAMGARGRAWALAHTGLDRFRAQLMNIVEEALNLCASPVF
jgi:glycosyltransferase involved in cell wall biosynthesis